MSGRPVRGNRRLRSLIGSELTLSLRDGCRKGLVCLASLAEGVLGCSSRHIGLGEFPMEPVKAFGQGVKVVTQTTAVVEIFLV